MTTQMTTQTWILHDSQGGEARYDAALSLAEVRADYESTYVCDGLTTEWADYTVSRDGDDEHTHTYTVRMDPAAPRCPDAAHHDWSDGDVRGHGGGVTCTVQCRHCGLRRITDTWAQRPDTGEQGLTSITYVADWLHDADSEEES